MGPRNSEQICCRYYMLGFKNNTNNLEESIDFINDIITRKKYKKIVAVGFSAGGYAAILFGSLLNTNKVLAFCPQTNLNILVKDGLIGNHKVPKNNIIPKHMDLNNVINKDTQYIIYADKKVKNLKNYHHINQCLNIGHHYNVSIIDNNPYLPNYKIMIKTKNLNKIFDNLISQE